MFDILRRKKNADVDEHTIVDDEAKFLISDSEAILRICRNSPHFGSMTLHELAFNFCRYQDNVSRERLEKALKFLMESKYIWWDGRMSAVSQIGFSKSNLPSMLPRRLLNAT